MEKVEVSVNMALIQCNFFSHVLQLNTSMTVILPQQTESQIGMQNKTMGEKHQTLYLLHGRSQDDTTWLRQTSIERYVAPLELAVVMPQVHRSSYTDMAYGYKFWTFLSEELPCITRSFFNLSHAREDNFVAGMSMGGYGALKWALSKPDQFAAAASLSGGVDRAKVPKNPARLHEYRMTFGDKPVAGTPNDLFWLLERCDKYDGPKPKIYQCCGTEDFLYQDNILFRDACRKTSLDFTYEEEPGTHEWGYWDRKIQDVLAWLPLRGRGDR